MDLELYYMSFYCSDNVFDFRTLFEAIADRKISFTSIFNVRHGVLRDTGELRGL